jgi:uncharacterized protein
MIVIDEKTEFDWDSGNKYKSLFKHKVTIKEAESVFLNDSVMVTSDKKHSNVEDRYLCLGISQKQKYLYISFTIRGEKIRIISARPMDRQERDSYEKIKKNTRF